MKRRTMGIALYTVRFEDGTESEGTCDSGWYPRPMGAPLVEDEAYTRKMFAEVGVVHPKHREHGAFMPTSEWDNLREPVEVVSVRYI